MKPLINLITYIPISLKDAYDKSRAKHFKVKQFQAEVETKNSEITQVSTPQDCTRLAREVLALRAKSVALGKGGAGITHQRKKYQP